VSERIIIVENFLEVISVNMPNTRHIIQESASVAVVTNPEIGSAKAKREAIRDRMSICFPEKASSLNCTDVCLVSCTVILRLLSLNYIGMYRVGIIFHIKPLYNYIITFFTCKYIWNIFCSLSTYFLDFFYIIKKRGGNLSNFDKKIQKTIAIPKKV